jgi:raffinose/stachyose/melibiose transport system permease protein
VTLSPDSQLAARGAAAQAAPRGARLLSRRRSPTAISPWFFWGWLAPALLITLVFMVWPFLESFTLSFQRWPGFGQPTYIGLKNLTHLINDPDAWGAIGRTLIWTAGEVVITVGVGTALAYAFHRNIPFSRTLKFLAFLPVILPPTFYALAYQYALNPTFGWINTLLGHIDGSLSRAWLSDPSAVLWIVIWVAGAQYVGIPMILMLSAFNDVPKDVEEAAKLDGVGAWGEFWHVTLPLSRDVLVVVVSLQLIGNFKSLDTVWALTQGGPGRASDIASTFIYREAFDFSNFGYGSAAGLATTLLIVVISLAYTQFFRPRGMSRI